MNIEDIILSAKNIYFDDLICQTEIETKEDAEMRNCEGFNILHTLEDFKQEYPNIDPSKIYYAPSISANCFYINYETLAVCVFPIEYVKIGFRTIEQLIEATQICEQNVAEGKYFTFLLGLPDSMRIEYIYRLVYSGKQLPEGIYKFFWDVYATCDYGFEIITTDFIKKLEEHKTSEDINKTQIDLDSLPDKITIYRGGNSESRPYQDAFSWTLSESIAVFFATRHGSASGYVVCGEIDKKDIIESLFDSTDEKELIVDPKNVRIIKKRTMHGIEFLNKNVQSILKLYHSYRDKIEYDFDFPENSHDEKHTKRVLLLALLIGNYMKLPKARLRELAEAAIYHDLGRINDEIDNEHGQRSKDLYLMDADKPKRVVEFLIEYHCTPDVDGYAVIDKLPWLSKDKKTSIMLYNILKDADALDRVRFGIKALDVKQLRLDISKELVLVAKLMLHGIE